MMRENTPRPAGRFAQARALYGRSTMAQLLIFMGLELARSLLLYLISLAVSAVSNLLVANGSIEQMYTFRQTFSHVQSFLSLVLAIGMLFLHRSVTFRSADRAVCTALPLAGLLLLNNLLGTVVAMILAQTGVAETVLRWCMEGHSTAIAIAVFAGLWLLSMLVSTLYPYAQAGTVHLARTKGKRILCILPILGLIPLQLLSWAVSWRAYVLAWSLGGGILFSLITQVSSLLSLLVTTACAFFAQRNLVYRDTCDTAPRTVQRLLARLAAEETRPAPPTAAQLEIERLNRQQSSLAWQMEGLNRQRDQLLQQMAGVQAALNAAEASNVPPAAPAPEEHS